MSRSLSWARWGRSLLTPWAASPGRYELGSLMMLCVSLMARRCVIRSNIWAAGMYCPPVLS